MQFALPPGYLEFGIDRQQQAAWRTAVLQAMLYEQAKDMATEQVEDYFERRTPTGFAAFICTVHAFEIGKTIGGTVDDPSSLLFTNVYDGSGEGVYDCAAALAAAEEASREEQPPHPGPDAADAATDQPGAGLEEAHQHRLPASNQVGLEAHSSEVRHGIPTDRGRHKQLRWGRSLAEHGGSHVRFPTRVGFGSSGQT